jgi:hypothetical protein
MFLSGVPKDFSALERLREYPLGLKVMAQYILMPIVLIYLAILTAYMGKIIITQDWPSGWIGYLVSSVATVGILSLLLLHPIQEQEENLWVQSYGRWFYVALFPSIIMLLLAIWKRVDQYGFTERRYFLVVLTAWLFGIALYYTIRRSKNIKVIPASLFVVALLAAFGPWSAYSVSKRSQTDRLSRHLARAGMLQDGTLRAAAGEVAFEDRREIGETLTYLIWTHGSRTIAPWFQGELPTIDTAGFKAAKRESQAIRRTQTIMKHLGVAYVSRAEAREPTLFHYRTRQGVDLTPIDGYDYMFHLARFPSDSVLLDGNTLRFTIDSAAAALRISDQGGELMVLPVAALADSVRSYLREHPEERSGLPPDLMRLEGENERLAVRVYVRRLSGRRTDDGTVPTQLTGEILLRLK